MLALVQGKKERSAEGVTALYPRGGKLGRAGRIRYVYGVGRQILSFHWLVYAIIIGQKIVADSRTTFWYWSTGGSGSALNRPINFVAAREGVLARN